MLLMAASVSLGSCKQEDVNSNGVTEKRDPNLISVSLDMSAGVQDSIAESEPKHQGRALSYTLEDGEKDGKTSFSILKFDTEKAPETLEAYGIFYCPTAPEGKKVYISNGPIQWKKKSVKGNKVRYDIHKGGIVDIDRSLMDGTHQWYFASVLGAEYDAAKEAQGLLELKIAKLEELVANARVIDESQLDTSKVLILSTVKLKNKANNAVMTYTLVAESEADLKSGKISVSSPIGRGLLGKSVGDIAEIKVPNGTLQMEIIEITR